MDVKQGEVPIILIIGVHHHLLLSPETLSPPLASTYMSCTSWFIQFAMPKWANAPFTQKIQHFTPFPKLIREMSLF